MKVAVTGADGFIGSHLCQTLADAGHEVLAMAHFIQRHTNNLVHPNIRIVPFDITSASYNLDMAGYDYLFHLAANGDVPMSKAFPDEYIRTNVLGTLNMARYAAIMELKLVLMSSSEVYGTHRDKITEDSELHPQSVYAASKIAAEAVVGACHYQYDLDFLIVRGFNTYGPGQTTRGVVSSIIQQALDPETEVITLGNLAARRDLVFVEDMASALASIVGAEFSTKGPYNIATGQSHAVIQIAETVKSILDIDKEVLTDVSKVRSGYDVEKLEGDSTTFRKVTGWEPKHVLYQGLEKTIEWWRG